MPELWTQHEDLTTPEDAGLTAACNAAKAKINKDFDELRERLHLGKRGEDGK